jgi:hypothetical protein
MSTLEELKEIWQQTGNVERKAVTQPSLEKLIKIRVSKHTKNSLGYFWASFTLQIIVYALFFHVILKYGQTATVLYTSIGGVVLYIPFTIMLLRTFKKIATEKPLIQSDIDTSLYDFVSHQQALLRTFYHFKKWYEGFSIPLSCLVGVFLVFELYVPGGVNEYRQGATITFLVSLASCIAAIYAENKKSFILPIKQLQAVLEEFKQDKEY